MKRTLAALILLFLASCNASDIEDAVDLAAGVPRKTIDTSKMGVNAFVNDSRFGTVNQQFLEVRDTLELRHTRTLFNWDDGAHPSTESSPDFSRTDRVVAEIPEGVDVLLILTGLPSWMSDERNWIDGNPRKTFVERWVRPVIERYGSHPRVIGWQIWNEPNMDANPENRLLGIAANPENYVEMLALASSISRDLAPSKLVLNAATTAINQNFPATRDYNRAMRDAGAQDFVDVWAIHYYGKQFENVVRDGGVADFLNGLEKPIWITESGEQGVNEQLAYVEQAWPYLDENINRLDRIYYYQFTEATPSQTTYGLRNLSTDAPVSDLYEYLRDRTD